MADSHLTRPWWTRRDFLQRSAAVAAGADGMRWGLADGAEIPMEFDGSKFQLAAPEPNPKHGGVLRLGVGMRPPHFDVHQSGTIFNLGSQGAMFVRGYFAEFQHFAEHGDAPPCRLQAENRERRAH